jgi:large subunit ribosomal protein L17
MKHGKKQYDRKCLARNLECLRVLLGERGFVRTTEKQARNMRRALERLITKGKEYQKEPDSGKKLHIFRQIGKYVGNNSELIRKIIDLGKKNIDRPGGYTRIVKCPEKNGRSSCILQVV